MLERSRSQWQILRRQHQVETRPDAGVPRGGCMDECDEGMAVQYDRRSSRFSLKPVTERLIFIIRLTAVACF